MLIGRVCSFRSPSRSPWGEAAVARADPARWRRDDRGRRRDHTVIGEAVGAARAGRHDDPVRRAGRAQQGDPDRARASAARDEAAAVERDAPSQIDPRCASPIGSATGRRRDRRREPLRRVHRDRRRHGPVAVAHSRHPEGGTKVRDAVDPRDERPGQADHRAYRPGRQQADQARNRPARRLGRRVPPTPAASTRPQDIERK